MKADRRTFIQKTSIVGSFMAMGPQILLSQKRATVPAGKRVGIIGLDTSHSTAFTKTFNDPPEGLDFHGYKVVAAYPHGRREIEIRYSRIPR